MVNKLILDIDDKLWEQFKKLVPRGVTLNEAVVNLIEKEVKAQQPKGETRNEQI